MLPQPAADGRSKNTPASAQGNRVNEYVTNG
jgi:hypothetical protein